VFSGYNKEGNFFKQKGGNTVNQSTSEQTRVGRVSTNAGAVKKRNKNVLPNGKGVFSISCFEHDATRPTQKAEIKFKKN